MRRSPVANRNGRTQEGRTGQESVRTAAVWIVERTLASRAPVDTFLSGVTEGFDERDQGLMRELVLGTLRWIKRLDHVLVQASGRRFDQIQEDLVAVLRVAIYQLLFLDRVPPHAIVSEAVDQAMRRSHRGAASFVNAVLRCIARAPNLAAWPVEESGLVERLAVETSHPEELVRRWLDRFGEAETRSLLAANNRPKPMHLLAFAARGTRAARRATHRRGNRDRSEPLEPARPRRARGAGAADRGVPARRVLTSRTKPRSSWHPVPRLRPGRRCSDRRGARRQRAGAGRGRAGDRAHGFRRGARPDRAAGGEPSPPRVGPPASSPLRRPRRRSPIASTE
ncbi:MAG: transcription antitermination factor NusB [Thermoanaerobaculia bacterium]